MVSILRKPSWAISEALATPEAIFVDRRAVLKAWGMGGLAAAALAAMRRTARAAESADPIAGLYPAKRNDAYKLDRPLTPEKATSTYNNFYEYGDQKDIWQAAQALKSEPWTIAIDGMVEKPVTLACDDLVRKFPLEERLYRHRCVEAWSMTIPWTGFPLASLVKFANPQASAKYLRFQTFMDPAMAPGQHQPWYPWPYVEGLTMEEATNELAFLVTGAYGKPLLKQYGAPIRLHLPWKYGFKSAKSLVKITFTDKRPLNFWQQLSPSEYGFWANVNPQVPHPRWSQAEEREIGTGKMVPTLLYNGYGEQVAGLYKDMKGEKLFM
jgi:methionine sulfoxide reductase catalytic subunit